MQELQNIVNAKRFDRELFQDDTEFANWARSRCQFTLGKINAAPQGDSAGESRSTLERAQDGQLPGNESGGKGKCGDSSVSRSAEYEPAVAAPLSRDDKRGQQQKAQSPKPVKRKNPPHPGIATYRTLRRWLYG